MSDGQAETPSRASAGIRMLLERPENLPADLGSSKGCRMPSSLPGVRLRGTSERTSAVRYSRDHDVTNPAGPIRALLKSNGIAFAEDREQKSDAWCT